MPGTATAGGTTIGGGGTTTAEGDPAKRSLPGEAVEVAEVAVQTVTAIAQPHKTRVPATGTWLNIRLLPG